MVPVGKTEKHLRAWRKVFAVKNSPAVTFHTLKLMTPATSCIGDGKQSRLFARETSSLIINL